MAKKTFTDGMGMELNDYKENLKKLILEDGLAQAGEGYKEWIQKVVNNITDWDDVDQLYDAGCRVQNFINEETRSFVDGKRWNEYVNDMKKHYRDQIQFTLLGVTNEEAEHKEYTDVLLQFKCIKKRKDILWNTTHLKLKEINQMVTELWKIKAHWMQKIENGTVEPKTVRVYTY